MFDHELLLAALRVLRQCAIHKAMRSRRITAPQNPAGIDPPQPADARHHRHDLSHFLTLDDMAADFCPSWKHFPRIQRRTRRAIDLMSTTQLYRMLVGNESVFQWWRIAQRLISPCIQPSTQLFRVGWFQG